MRVKVSTIASLPTAALLILLLLDIGKPGYRKFLFVPEFKSQMSKKWDEVRPTVDAYISQPQQTQSPQPKPTRQPTSPFQRWTSPTPAQPPQAR